MLKNANFNVFYQLSGRVFIFAAYLLTNIYI